jgi:hypothetical protein
MAEQTQEISPYFRTLFFWKKGRKNILQSLY